MSVLLSVDTFVLALMIGVLIGSIHAYFRYVDSGSPQASFRTLLGWLLAFAITGMIASPIADWILEQIY